MTIKNLQELYGEEWYKTKAN